MAIVSVVTTAYNHQDTLQRAVDSVQRQTIKDIQHIIIDDTKTKNGMMETYRKGLSLCKGEYIAFCDGDDYWPDHQRLEKQLNYMKDHEECSLCITRCYTEQSGIRTLMKETADFINKNMSYDNLLRGNAYIYAPTYLIRKSHFDKYIDFNKFMKFNVWDYPIVLELIQHTSFHCLEDHTSVFTKNDESVTQTKSRAKRARYLWGNYKIKWHYIKKYGCKLSTLFYLMYKVLRDIYSIGGKRWT